MWRRLEYSVDVLAEVGHVESLAVDLMKEPGVHIFHELKREVIKEHMDLQLCGISTT